jgi:hypothetical protein
VDEVAITVIVDVRVPSEGKVTFAGLKNTDGPTLEIEAVKLTLPANPFRLARLIVELPEDSSITVRLGGLALRVKSGCGDGLAVTTKLTELTNALLVPVIVML